MKKILFSLTGIITLATLVLASCASKANASAPSNGVSSSSNGNSGSTNQPLPQVGQLLVGTFKLEGTANAVDAAEAAQLLPLWQAYSQLLASNTTAQAEVDAVVSQIQSTMTPQQVQAITAMKLTRQDEFTLMSSLGLGFRGTGTPGFSGTPRQGGGGGQFFFGGGGGGGGGFGGAGGTGGFNPTQLATLRAQRTRTAGFGEVPTPLLRELISTLQKKSQPSATSTPTP